MSAKRFVVRGRVQGVMFRYATAERAQPLGLSGKVWNRDDGAVEVIAEGDPAALAELERWLHEGPPHARVDHVETEDLPEQPERQGFAIG